MSLLNGYHNSWENVTAIGIDEIAWKKGHKYLTLVYQINDEGRRLLFVAQERTKESLAQFFRLLKADNCSRIESVVSDMLKSLQRILKHNLKTMRTRLQPLMSVTEMLRRHKRLLLTTFRARGEVSAGPVEGLNGKAKLTRKQASGFKSYKVAAVALLHTRGKVPPPEVTHRFR